MTPSALPLKMPTPLIIPKNLPNNYTQPTPPLTPLTPTTPCHPLHASPPSPHHSLLTLPYTRILGTGAWSAVYALTPDLAVKTPSNPSAIPILRSEASILTHLTNTLQNPTSIARIHAYDHKTSHLYLDLIPTGTLESYIFSCTPHHPLTPAIGFAQWLFLTERLTRTLSELRTCGVVHGDIKLSNIMLRTHIPSDPTWAAYCKETGETLYEPVLVDFSSSHFVREGEVPDAVSAVTTSFAAPELLAAFLSRPPTPGGAEAHPVPTFGSDLYSLAVTLLGAAVGSEVYCNAGRHVGIYARQGNPVGWVRSDDRGVRVRKGGMVAGVLEGCFGKTAEGRVEIEVVRDRVEQWKQAWWGEGRKKGWRWGC